MKRYFRWVLRHRVAVLLVCAALSGLSAFMLKDAVVASSLGKLFLGNSPAFQRFTERADDWGTQEIVVLGFKDVDVLSPEFLARLELLEEELEGIPDVGRVSSVRDLLHSELQDGALQLTRYVDAAERYPERREELRAALVADATAAGTLVSPDGRHTALVVELGYDEDRAAERAPQLVGEVLDAARAAGFDADSLPRAGILAQMAEIIRLSYGNITRVFPIVVVILLSLVWLIFRQLWPVLLTGVVSGVSVLWTMGLAVAIDPEINIFMTVVPAVMVIVGFSDVIHLVSAYLLELGRLKDKHAAIEAGAVDVGTACLLTSVTTCLGFLSISLIPTPVFRQLGVVLGFGVATALFLAMTLVPILLSYLPAPEGWTPGGSRTQELLDGFLGRMERLATGRPRTVIAGFVVLTAVAGYGVSRLQIGTDFEGRMDEDNPIREAGRWFDEHFAGTEVFDLFITVDEDEGFLDPERFARVAAFQDELAGVEGVDAAVSIVDPVRSMHRVQQQARKERAAGGSGDESGDSANPQADSEPLEDLPSRRRTLSRYLTLLEMSAGDESWGAMDEGRRELRVAVRADEPELRQLTAVANRAAELGRQRLDAEVEVNGLLYLFGDWLDEIVAGQRRGVLVSFLSIALMMIIGLRSIRVGLWSMVPNALPLLVLGGYVGLAWPHVDSDTLIIAMMAIGIGVDDTIHFLMRYRIESLRTDDSSEAVARTFHFAGRAIVITTIILVIGFLPFAATDYFSTRIIGTLLPLTLVVALVADLLLVPALVQVGALGFRRPAP